MKKQGQIFIIVLFVWCFSVFANAQDVPNYLFLETIDSNEKPLKDAVVTLTNPKWQIFGKPEEIGKGRQTDAEGTARFELSHISNDFSGSLFKISKNGYFDFFDFGVPMRSRDIVKVRIELFRIPESNAEKTALGNEQLKREFLWAAKSGDGETVRKLLKKGINPNLSTGDLRGVSAPKNIPAVLFAATSGDSKTVNLLLKAGANVRAQKEPLHSILAYYLRANPVFRRQPQTAAERKPMFVEYQTGIKILIKAGAATNDLLSFQGLTALMVAARQNDAESAELLVKLGVPVNYNIEGYTALINAVDQYGHNQPGYTPIKVAEVLLKSGADPNIAVNPANGGNCRSVLMQAAFGGDLELVKLLIKYKADVHFTCKNGDSALKWAKRYSVVSPENQREMIKILEAAL